MYICVYNGFEKDAPSARGPRSLSVQQRLLSEIGRLQSLIRIYTNKLKMSRKLQDNNPNYRPNRPRRRKAPKKFEFKSAEIESEKTSEGEGTSSFC